MFEIADLAVSFDSAGGRVQAVDGLSLAIHPRQTVALVGESVCGKSVTAMTVLQLIPRPPGRFDRGSILFEGRDLLSMTERQMLKVRGGEVAMIFQEPTENICAQVSPVGPLPTCPRSVGSTVASRRSQ